MHREGFLATQLIAFIIVVSIGTLASFLFIFKPESRQEIEKEQAEVATPQPTPQQLKASPYERNPALKTVTYEDTARDGWKKYKNGEFGFELIIPEDMFESTRGCCVIEADRGNNSEDIVILYFVFNIEEYKTQTAKTANSLEDRSKIPEDYRSAPEDFIASTEPNDLLINFQRLQAVNSCLVPEPVCFEYDSMNLSEINSFAAVNSLYRYVTYTNPQSTASSYAILVNNNIYNFKINWRTLSKDAEARQDLFDTIISSFNT